MLVGLPPFYSKDTQEMYEKILHAKLAFPSHVSLRARSIISGLLHRSAHFRLGSGPNNTSSPQSIKLHPFFEGMNWGALERREIKPPYVPDVRHNYDLRNIDPTFVNEPIPNSVLLDGNPTILKNVENKVPWKVEVCATTFENEAFQGFTFVPTSNEGYLKKLSQENE